MRAVLGIADVINETVGRIVGFFVVLVTVIVVYDLIARNLFGAPTQWVFEVTKHLYAAHFMLLAGYGLLHNAHIRVDVVRERLSARMNDLLEVVGYVVFFFPFMAVLVWYGWQFAIRSWRAGETTMGVIALPVYPVKTVIVAAAVLLTIQGVAQFVRSLAHLFGRR